MKKLLVLCVFMASSALLQAQSNNSDIFIGEPLHVNILEPGEYPIQKGELPDNPKKGYCYVKCSNVKDYTVENYPIYTGTSSSQYITSKQILVKPEIVIWEASRTYSGKLVPRKLPAEYRTIKIVTDINKEYNFEYKDVKVAKKGWLYRSPFNDQLVDVSKWHKVICFDRADKFQEVKKALERKGYLFSKARFLDYKGTELQSAVFDFQYRNNINADGLLNEETVTALGVPHLLEKIEDAK